MLLILHNLWDIRGGSRNNIIRRLLAVCKNNKIKKEKFKLEAKARAKENYNCDDIFKYQNKMETLKFSSFKQFVKITYGTWCVKLNLDSLVDSTCTCWSRQYQLSEDRAEIRTIIIYINNTYNRIE
jgi:hypothetical protein